MKRLAASLLVLTTLLAVIAGGFWWSGTSTQAAPTVSAIGNAYAHIAAGTVKLQPTRIGLGPLVPVWRGCGAIGMVEKSANNLDLQGLGNLGTAKTTANVYRTDTSTVSQATSTIQGLNILNGLVTAEVLKAVATSEINVQSATNSGKGTLLANITLGQGTNAKKIVGDVAPNSKLEIAGIGKVVLNEQFMETSGSDKASMTINLIHIYVGLNNTLGLQAGVDIVIGHASSKVVRTAQPRLLSARAYDIKSVVNIAGISDKVGPLADAELSCEGGTYESALITIKTLPLGLGSLGVAQAQTSGFIQKDKASATGNIKITDIKLLGTLGTYTIDVEALTAKANVTQTNTVAFSGEVVITKGRIAGIKLDGAAKANTRINLAGLGYVILNEQIIDNNNAFPRITVNALHIVVTTKNLLKLPIGVEIVVGHAEAGIQKV